MMAARRQRTQVPRERTRLAVAVACDGVRTTVARAELAALAAYVLRAERVRDAMLSVALITPRAIATLNQRHLGHRRPTDVLAFGLQSQPKGDRSGHPSVVVGDVYVCPAVARAHATRLGVPVRDELRRLVVHGTLHVLGWTHPDTDTRDTSPMWARQERLLRNWNRRSAG